MKQSVLYHHFKSLRKQGRKAFGVLIDPDKQLLHTLDKTITTAERANVDYFFVGSSLLLKQNFEQVIHFIKKNSNIPVILFPGSQLQISKEADGILLLSLISGRNPELLIGQHVTAAPVLNNSKMEIIPTGYMLVDGGTLSSVSYISNSIPIPANKTDIAVATAMAGEMLGLKTLYLEAGSGAIKPVSANMIREVKKNTNIPLIVGGGIETAKKAAENCEAGADIIVVGNKLEQDPGLINEMSVAIHSSNVQPETV